MKATLGIILLALTISTFAWVCTLIAYRREKKALQRKRLKQLKKINIEKVWYRSPDGVWSKN